MRNVMSVTLAVLVLLLSGCIQLFPENNAYNRRIREFTTRDALDVLGIPRMANTASLEAKFTELRSYLLPQYAEALGLVRAGEAVSKGATAAGVTVFVIDDFSTWKFQDGRYHGDYVSATIKLIAPQAKVLTCDAWKTDLGDCLFEAYDLAKSGKIHVVNMSLGIIGTYCEFSGTNFSNTQLVKTDYIQKDTEPFEPNIFLQPDQAEALEHWVRDIRAVGVTVISSAGNDGYKRGAKAPGCWSSLAVGGVYDAHFDTISWSACIDENVNADDRICWSNYGQVFAPGAKVDNIFSGGISFNGTSVAAPITSGVSALVIGTKKIKGDAVAQQIINTAVSIRDRYNTGLPHKRIDAVVATGVGDPIPPSQTLRGFLDKNKNCVIDDAEIITALLLWITQAKWDGKNAISTSEMIGLLNDWIKQSNICNK